MKPSNRETKQPGTGIGSKISVADQKCCIANCKLWKTKAKSLHPIPNHSPMVQMRWFNFIRQSRGLTWTPKDDHNVPLVCSLHFSEKSYISNTNKLKPNACPIFDGPKVTRRRPQVRRKTDSAHHDNHGSAVGSFPTKHVNAFVTPCPPISGVQDLNPVSTGINSTIITRSALQSTTQTSPDSFQVMTVPITMPPRLVAAGSATTPPIFLNIHMPQQKSAADQAGSGAIRTSTQTSTTGLNQCGQPLPILPHFGKQIIVLPGPSSISQLNTGKTTLFQPAPLHTPVVELASVQNINPDPTIPSSSKCRPLPPTRFIPSKMGFCLVCDKNIESLDPFERIDEADIVKSRAILLGMLNFNVEDTDVSDSYPICLQCNFKVLDLQKCLDKLIKQQEEMERQRNELLKEIVRTFCRRMSTASGSVKFVSADAVHSFITKKWASTLHPPYSKVDPNWKTDVNIVKEIISERKRKAYKRRRELTLESRIAYYNKQNMSRQKREEKLQRIEENRLRSMRGEKTKRPKKRCLDRIQCPVCSIELLKISLKNHMETHTGELKHICDLCGRAFLREANLRTHRQTHAVGDISFGRGDRNYECEYCKKVLHSGKRYNRHIVTEHMTPKNEQGQVLIEPRNKCVIFYDCDSPNCNLSISNKEDFYLHLLLHTTEFIQCSVEGCLKKFASASGLSTHEKFHESSNPTSILKDCPYCHEYFDSDRAFETHRFFHEIRIDPQAFKFICDECGCQYVTEFDLEVHKKDRHRRKESIRLGGTKKSYQLIICEVCGLAFNAESRLKMHSYVHTHPEGFPCHACKKLFPNPTKLYLHTKRQDCSREDSNTNDVNDTVETETTEIDGDNDSPGTSKTTSSKPQRSAKTSEYIRRSKQWRFNPLSKKAISRQKKTPEPKPRGKRSTWKPLTCKHCDFVSRGSMYLYRRHLLVHHPDIYVNGKEYFCHVCWLNYATEEELNEHFKLHERYRCKICSKILGNIVRLHQHQRIHTGEKPYQCSLCQKKFSLEVNLKEHELRHTGQRPYTCPACPAGFFRKKQMAQHIQRLHNGSSNQDGDSVSADSFEDDVEAVSLLPTSVETEEVVHSPEGMGANANTGVQQLEHNPLIDFSNFLIAPSTFN